MSSRCWDVRDKIMSFFLLAQPARAIEVQMTFILKLLTLMYFIFESVRIASPNFAVSCFIHGGWKGNVWTCHPVALLRVSVQEKVWRAPLEKHKTIEHTRSGAESRASPPAFVETLASCRPSVPLSLRASLYGPWIKAQTLSTTLRPLWPSFAVYSSRFQACLKHFPLVLTVWSECLCTVFSYCCASARSPSPKHGGRGGRQGADFSSTWFLTTSAELHSTKTNRSFDS